MPLPNHARCDSCIFWERYGANYPECRRHAPVTMPIAHISLGDHGPAVEGVFPRMPNYGWCGDHTEIRDGVTYVGGTAP